MSFATHFTAAGLTKAVVFRMEHATFAENPEFTGKKGEVLWLRTQGCPINQGNYKLFYQGAFKPPFKLRLEVGDSHRDIDVSLVKSGMGINPVCLRKFLAHVASLRCWAPQTVKCRLVVTKDRTETASDWVTVTTPVEPWTKEPNDVEAMTRDNTIRYCGDLDKKIFYGRILKEFGGKYYFTFKNSLESNPELRGFACIGLVGNLYQIAPGPAYQNGEDMAAALTGTAVDGVGERRSPHATAIKRPQLLEFIKNAGRTGTYMIWTGGHAGLIKNGVLYECKPSGKGFTNERYTGSAVRRYESDRLPHELKNREDPYFLSKLPA
jgi:hypothetical protein